MSVTIKPVGREFLVLLNANAISRVKTESRAKEIRGFLLEALDDAEADGRSEGRSECEECDEDAGYDSGYDEGYNVGYADGTAECEECDEKDQA